MKTEENTTPRLLRKTKVAAMLDTSVRTVDRLIASGVLPRVNVLGGVRVPVEAVEQLIERGVR